MKRNGKGDGQMTWQRPTQQTPVKQYKVFFLKVLSLQKIKFSNFKKKTDIDYRLANYFCSFLRKEQKNYNSFR